MLFFIFLSKFLCEIFPIHLNEPLEIYQNLKDKTVVLVKSTIMVKNQNDLIWSEADPSIPLMTSLRIYKTGGLSSNEKVELFMDNKYEPHNVFLFTSYEGAGFYSFDFDVQSKVDNLYGLKLEIYEGRPQNTEIVSGIDYHLTMLTEKVGEILDFARKNFEMEEMGEEDEAKYVKLYNYIFSLVYKISFLKIITLFATIFYFNKSVKDFFITNKIAK
ncbi:transmembrane EMP24 domain-containing protein [Vairimorpha necatrix]|uniref:Transmembrane EMP24 domain-containing protein n=1 Tax=Vairimorpha necatrix TaxID=6039 RepID=A0AAX4JCV2_9MICR